ncbi:hypothetical protein PF003_g7433 [Phytophthora fragariae]|nr:hypothetical protein PF003_g7433 [Phytophthora fragariae]
MPESTDGLKYVLVIKDDMSGYVELIECADPDAKTRVEGYLTGSSGLE